MKLIDQPTASASRRIPGWIRDRHCEEVIPDHEGHWDWHSIRDRPEPSRAEDHVPALVSVESGLNDIPTPFDSEDSDHDRTETA